MNFETASRKGEPFDMLIDSRGFLPNPVSRYCSPQLKYRRVTQHLNMIDFPDAIRYIGLRADEPIRAAKLHNKVNDGHECYCPLFADGVTAKDVGKFWSEMNFDLNLPNNSGVTDWGNCDLCHLKNAGKKQS